MVEFRRQDTNIMKSLVTTVRSQSLLKYLVIIYRQPEEIKTPSGTHDAALINLYAIIVT